MKKVELRKIYKQKRKELTGDEIANFQKEIYKEVFEYDFSTIQNIHIFLPIEKQIEIDTYPIINFLREHQKTIVVSKSCFKTATLQHFVFDENTELAINSYGIPEPINAVGISPQEIDLVFVPLLISDQRKYRVGYGKGFYDRFLASCKPTVKTLGINFFKPISKIIDVDTFDFPLDEVIYPK